MSYIKFEGVEDSRVRENFLEMAENYPPLKSYNLILEQKPIRKTTMRAQPVISSYLGAKKKFKVQYNEATRLRDVIRIEEVPEAVLKGWFAHELGHVMDYRHRSMLGMIWFGLRYVLSRRYRKKVEHMADEYAIAYGMANDILATKKYILEHSELPDKYKRRIRKYYMSEKNVHRLIAKLEEFQPDDANVLDPNP